MTQTGKAMLNKIYILLFLAMFPLLIAAQENSFAQQDFDAVYLKEIKEENTQLSARIKTFSETVKQLNKQAAQAIRNNDYKNALNFAFALDSTDPDNADIKNFKGKMLAITGEKEKAITAFSEAIKLNPGNRWFYINKAGAQADAGKLKEALLTINELNSRFPQWSIGYNYKGALLHALKKNKEAVAAYTTAINSEPKSALIATNLGDLQLFLNNREAAIKAYSQALTWQPDYKRAQQKLDVAVKVN